MKHNGVGGGSARDAGTFLGNMHIVIHGPLRITPMANAPDYAPSTAFPVENPILARAANGPMALQSFAAFSTVLLHAFSSAASFARSSVPATHSSLGSLLCCLRPWRLESIAGSWFARGSHGGHSGILGLGAAQLLAEQAANFLGCFCLGSRCSSPRAFHRDVRFLFA